MAWIAVIGALAGAALSSEASKNASKTLAGASGDANAAQLAMYQQSRTDQMPYRTVGMSALERLAGGAGLNTPTLTGVTRDTQASLVDTSKGIPGYNATLYANNDAYRKAWDDVQAAHNASYTFADGYAADSDPAWIEAEIRRRLPAAEPAQNVGRGGADGAPAGADPTSNPLTRRFSLADLEADPVYQQSYQAGLDMGQKQLTASLGARGVLNSGGAAKALTRYASDYAAQRGNEAFNRFQVGQGNERNFLSSLAGIGQQAVNQTQAAGTNYGNNASNLAMAAGQNAAAGQIAQGNIWGGTVQGIGNWYQNQSTLDRLMAERERDRAAYGRTSAAPASGPSYDWETGWGVQ